MSPKFSSLAFDEKELEDFVPELNVIVNKRHKINETSTVAAEIEITMSAVEIKGMFTVSF